MGYMDQPETRKKLDNINITIEIRRGYIANREKLRSTDHLTINGFKDIKISNEIASITNKINRLTKNINYQRQELF